MSARPANFVFLAFPHGLYRSELYETAMGLLDVEDARQHFETLVRHDSALYPNVSREDIEQRIRYNLGYYSSFYSRETRNRVQRLFGVVPPLAVSADICEGVYPPFTSAIVTGTRPGGAACKEVLPSDHPLLFVESPTRWWNV